MQTSLCYIEKENKYLMLHRISKTNDPNKDKWLGVGGKFEKDESPEECMIREVKEETGLDVIEYKYRGIITFVSNEWSETEYMHLFTVSSFEGTLKECDEGKLEWIEKDKIKDLPIWEGDLYFLNELCNTNEFFSMKLVYVGSELKEVTKNGKRVR